MRGRIYLCLGVSRKLTAFIYRLQIIVLSIFKGHGLSKIDSEDSEMLEEEGYGILA